MTDILGDWRERKARTYGALQAVGINKMKVRSKPERKQEELMTDELSSKQLKFKVVSGPRWVLTRIIILAALILVVLPFWLSFQDVLTQVIMKIKLYESIQNVIVPYELRVVGKILTLVGLPIRVGNVYIEWEKASGESEVIFLAWNCVGWQTLVLFIVTLFSGLSGKHTWPSKLEALAIGSLGTYLVNIFRLGLVVVVYFGTGRAFGVVFHDYFSSLLSLGWLFFFWWFSYAYVLVELE